MPEAPVLGMLRAFATVLFGWYIMKCILAGIGLALLASTSTLADDQGCASVSCPREVRMSSVARDKIYGLLLGAPAAGCRRVRYRVETSGRKLLGRTPALAAGEVAVVRIGNGFSTGPHALIVTAEGCGRPPGLFRRVTLHKSSPDHGWRASRTFAALADRP